MTMTHRRIPVLTAMLFVLWATGACAQTVPKSQLGDLALEFAAVRAVTLRPGHERLVQVATLPADELLLQLPFMPNRIEWLVGDGALVARDAPVARISGPELEHWVLAAALLQARFDDARDRYERNRALYAQNAVSADTWQSILDRYHTLQIEQQHTLHVLEWLDVENDDGHAVTALLRVPLAGHVLFSPDPMGDEPLIARIAPAESLRLTMRVPQEDADAVQALATADCELAVALEDQRVEGFSRRLYSVPLDGCAPARPGLQLSGFPLYRFAGYAVPRSAVIGYRGQSYIAAEEAAGLQLIPVRIAGESQELFYVSTDEALADRRVLVRSSSALQGLLLGLGDN